MQSNILSSIELICQEKKLSKERVLQAIEQALAAAYRKDFGNKLQNICVEFDPETGKMKTFDEKTIVENLPTEKEIKKENEATESKEKRFNPKTEIQISEVKQNSVWQRVEEKQPQKKESKKKKVVLKIGDVIRQELEIPSDFGRIAAQTAKQVIIQRLREAERETILEKYESQVGKIINGVIQRKDRQTIYIDLLDTTAVMPYHEQVQEEKYWPDQKLKFYVISANKTPKGPEIIVSRRHPDVLRELFKLEIPEVANETVELKSIAREPGARSKVAVWTTEKSIDPIGAAIGQRGVRIQTIISEIGGEKIDIIQYSDDPEEFIKNAMAPAKVSSLKINKKEKTAQVRINKNQLSLAIGKAGQNVRLAAKLTGWKIDVVEEKEPLIKKSDADEKEKKKTKKAEKNTKEKKTKKVDKEKKTKKQSKKNK